MGWIADRHMKQGGSINRNPAKQRKGPLRQIVAILRVGKGMFDSNWVELECGHQVSSNGTYRARCNHCRREAERASTLSSE